MRKYINVFVLLVILLFPITADTKVLFTVQTIYFKPFGAPKSPESIERIAELMQKIRNLYRSEMDRHGYGLKTFRHETDKSGNIVVHTIKGKNRITDYDKIHSHEILKEVADKFREPNNIYVIILGGLRQINDGSGTPRCHIHMNSPFTNNAHGGYIMIASECSFGVLSIAKALGSEFDLSNHVTDKPSLMGDGTARTGISTESLTFYQARWLSRHRYFNDVPSKIIKLTIGIRVSQPIIDTLKIYKVHSFYVIDKDIVRIRFTCSRKNPLHQAQISGLGWAEFDASSNTAEIIVEKSYLSNFQETLFLTMDIEGNIGKLEVNIAYMLANAIDLKLMTWAFLKTLR